MQWSSRIHIKVKSTDVWERLFDIDSDWIDESGEDFFDTDDTYIVIDGDWGCPQSELQDFVCEISDALGEDGIVVADCTSTSVDPFTFYAYSFGDGVKMGEESVIDDEEEAPGDAEAYDAWCDGKMWAMYENTDINKICDWINYCRGFIFSEKELEVLKSFGIEAIETESGIEYIECGLNFGLDDEITLSGTQYEGRIARIEKVNVGDKVTLIREHENEYDNNAIDVHNIEGSLGHLDMNAARILAPLLDKGIISYEATISSVTPLSQRSARCRNALIAIHVEAKVKGKV